MGQLIRSRKVIFDVTYKCIPFMFVVLTVLVSTALLSTSGHPPRGIVVTFGVFAGLLVVIFLACHLMIYCTRVKHEIVDREGGKGSNGHAGPNIDASPGFLTGQNGNGQGQRPGRDQLPQQGPGRDGQQRQSQSQPNHRMSRDAQAHCPAAQLQSPGLGSGARPVSGRQHQGYQAENRMRQQHPRRTSVQGSRDSSFLHGSLVPYPLKVTGHQAGSIQQRPQPGLASQESLVRTSHSRHTSSGDGAGSHSVRTSLQAGIAEPPPQESTRQRRLPCYNPRTTDTAVICPDTLQDIHSDPAFASPPGASAGTRHRRAETTNTVHAQVALLDGPGPQSFASAVFPDLAPGAQLRLMSPDDCFRRRPWGEDDSDLVACGDVQCRVVLVHPAAPQLETVRSLKGSVRAMSLRNCNDSGYHSASSSQYSPSLPTQPSGTPLELSATSASSRALTWTRASSDSPFSPSWPSLRTEPIRLRRRSIPTMASESMGGSGRVGMGNSGRISATLGAQARHESLRPRGRSKTC
jgi:hypothetical protein